MSPFKQKLKELYAKIKDKNSKYTWEDFENEIGIWFVDNASNEFTVSNIWTSKQVQKKIMDFALCVGLISQDK